MAEQQILIKRRVRGIILLAVWMMIFVFPALIALFSLDYLFNLVMLAGKRVATTAMTSEMDSFRRDLEVTSFLQRKLENYFSAAGSAPVDKAPLLAMTKLADSIGLQPVALISHSADTLDIDYHLHGVAAAEIKNLSRSLMRRYLVIINQQMMRAFHSPAAEAATRSIFRFADQNKTRKDTDLFFRRTFSLISEIPLVPDRVVKSISGRLGGVVYFYYHPFTRLQDGQKLITGGQLLVFRGADIPFKTVAAAAVANASSGLHRSFTRFQHSFLHSDNNLQEIITRFTEDRNGYHFISSFSQNSLNDLIQQGTLIPKHLEEVLAAMPLLKVSVPWRELQHPLQPYSSYFIFSVKLFVLSGALLMLYFAFFGIEFNAGIAVKVVAGTVFILILPLFLLGIGLVSRQQLNRVQAWYNAENSQQQFFAEFSDSFRKYQQTIQHQAFAMAQSAKKLYLQQNQVGLHRLLKEQFAKTVASDLAFDLPDRMTITLAAREKGASQTNEEESLRRLTSSAVINAFDENDNFTEVYKDGQKKSLATVDTDFINNLITRRGKLYQGFRFKSDSRFSSVYLHRPGKKSPMGILTLKFANEMLLRDFAGKYSQVQAASPEMEIKYYLIRDGSGMADFQELFSNQEVTDPELVNMLAMSASFGYQARRVNNRDLIQIFAMSEFPLLVMTRLNNVVGQHDSQRELLVLTSYSLLLLVFVFMVFKLIYLRPIREFVRVTEAVAAGDYQQQVALSQTDEFGDLKTSFDEMIQGLEQRRRLSHFVSREVLNAVESDAQDSMAVGGERIEASVAFVQLEQLQHLPEDAAAGKIFAILSDFIAAADASASKHGGVVDKLVEDTLMLVFRGSAARCDHALSASAAVLELEQKMRSLGLRICAGIASGPVVSGRIGSRLGKLDFTVIGDTVNLAARLKGEAKKATGTGIIIAPGSIRILKGRARVTFIARSEIKGKSREYPLYELVGLR